MKKFFLFTVILAITLASFIFANENKFVTVWQTDINSSIPDDPYFYSNDVINTTPDQITLPLVHDGTYRFVVDWGDGTISKIDNYSKDSKLCFINGAGI